jgi:hypothetical protein
MDKEQGIPGDESNQEGSRLPEQTKPMATRRRFNQGAATGAAVLLTLGNQVTWGQSGGMCLNKKGIDKTKTKVKMKCISTQVWTSNGGSFHKKGKKHDAQREAFQAFLDSGGIIDLEPPANPNDTCAIKTTTTCPL